MDTQHGLEADDRRAPGGMLIAVSEITRRTAMEWCCSYGFCLISALGATDVGFQTVLFHLTVLAS